MKWLLIPLILILSTLTLASEIKCFSGGDIIYSGKVKDILFDGNSIVFTDIKTGKDILVIADCIIQV